tara:strand:+ start:43487 stop:44245 length:759 start_codon:yes stop_codon:yes gene_type:complete
MFTLRMALIPAICLAFGYGATQAALVSYFNFEELSIGDSDAPGQGGVPLTIDATTGIGSISLADWGGGVNDISGNSGNLNRIDSDTAASLRGLFLRSSAGDARPDPLGGTFPGGNGTFIQLDVDLDGFADPVISYALRSNTATPANTESWSWSTDGVNFTSLPDNYTAGAGTGLSFQIQTVDFSGITELTDAPNASFRFTVTDYPSAGANTRIDNLQLNASLSAVPEPSSFSVLALAATSIAATARRRRKRA